MDLWYSFRNSSREDKLDLKEIPTKGIRLYCYILVSNFFKLIRLNLLYILFCLPIITIPAATGGLVRVLVKLIRSGQCFVFLDFYEEFKTNFKKYSCIGLFSGAFIFILYLLADYCIVSIEENPIYFIVLFIETIGFLLLVSMNFYSYVLTASVKLKFFQTLKNAFLLSVASLHRNILLFVSIIVIAVITYYLLPFSIIWIILIGFSMSGLALCQIIEGPISKYITDPYINEKQKII